MSYRKIDCPPIPDDGRWSLTIERTGKQWECTDLAKLLRIMTKKLAEGYDDARIVFLRW